MSKKKTRKQELQAKKSNENREKQIKELQKLREKAILLEKRIAEQQREKIKQFNIRNLKIFGITCNFVTPFLISTGVIVGTFKIFDGGLPFHVDEIKKYKTYSLDYQTSGYVTMDESYRKNRWFDNSLPSNELTIYTPWEYKDNQYIRYKRDYNIDTINTLDLFDAVLKEDYTYIKEHMKDYKEEFQVANSIEETEGQAYFIDASLHMLDKDDTLKYSETDLKNIIITIIEVALGLGIGGIAAHSRKFRYVEKIQAANRSYRYKIEVVKSMKEELTTINEKILFLSRKKGGKTNAK